MKLLRVSEIVERLQLSRSKVYELIESGRLPHYRIGASVRVAEEQLEAFLESVRQESAEPPQSRVPRRRSSLKHIQV